MNKFNEFSVLMPVYFADDHEIFKRAISSIFNNSKQPRYLYIVVDGPLSTMLNKVINQTKAEYSKQCKIFRLKKNMGIIKALNFGLNKASEEIIIRADADDINNSHRFSILLNGINKGYDIVGSNITEFLDHKKLLTRYVPINSSDIKKVLKYRNPFNHMSVAFRRSKIISLGGYPELKFFEDYALWAKAIQSNLKVKNINKSLVNVTVNKNFYKRRGGFFYISSIVNFQKYLLNLKVIDKKIFFFNILIRSFVAIIFSSLRYFIYNFFLRAK
jgi:glycosyltransferase involved in cell wall biosynthesis